ncbi:MAG: hypothetical protein ACRCX2_10080 [Paraclostridium sp.]
MLGLKVTLVEGFVLELLVSLKENSHLLDEKGRKDILDIANTLRAIWIKLEREDCATVLNEIYDNYLEDKDEPLKEQAIYRDRLMVVHKNLCEVYKIIG